MEVLIVLVLKTNLLIVDIEVMDLLEPIIIKIKDVEHVLTIIKHSHY